MEVKTAMYCFYNHGWTPSFFMSLPLREKILISCFMEYDLEQREKSRNGGK